MRKRVASVGAVLFFVLLGSMAVGGEPRSQPEGFDSLGSERVGSSTVRVTRPAESEPFLSQDDADRAVPCSPETAECLVTLDADSDVCKARKSAGNCTVRYQGEFETLEEAKARCEFIYGVGNKESGVLSCGPCHWVQSANADPVEKCKKLCDKINVSCIAGCPRGDKGCMRKCNTDYSKCLRECTE